MSWSFFGMSPCRPLLSWLVARCRTSSSASSTASSALFPSTASMRAWRESVHGPSYAWFEPPYTILTPLGPSTKYMPAPIAPEISSDGPSFWSSKSTALAIAVRRSATNRESVDLFSVAVTDCAATAKCRSMSASDSALMAGTSTPRAAAPFPPDLRKMSITTSEPPLHFASSSRLTFGRRAN